MKKTNAKWESFNENNTPHIHENVIPTSLILKTKHYPEDHDEKKRSISDLTIEKLEYIIEEKIRKGVRMQVSSFLASMKGFSNGPRIKKEREVGERKYLIT